MYVMLNSYSFHFIAAVFPVSTVQTWVEYIIVNTRCLALLDSSIAPGTVNRAQIVFELEMIMYLIQLLVSYCVLYA